MSEQIAPCPVCGGEATLSVISGCAVCRNVGCQMLPQTITAWNRLSRAAALLRAVEGLGAIYTADGRGLIVRRYGDKALDAADALILLAQKLEARDA